MQNPLDPREEVVTYTEEVISYPPPAPVYQPVVPVQPVVQRVAQPVVQQVVQPVAAVNDKRVSYSQVGDSRVETVQENYIDPSGNLVQQHEQVFEDPYRSRLNLLNRSTQVIYFFLGLLEVILGLRFFLRVLNAENIGFANFVYNFTNPFVVPFNGIFNDQALNRAGVLEFSTLMAMVIYALVAYGIVQLMNLLLAPSRSSREVYSSTRRRG